MGNCILSACRQVFSHQAPSLKVASFLPALLLILGVTWLVSSGDKSEDFRDGDSEPTSLPLCHYRYHSYKSGEHTSGAPLLAASSPPGHPSVCPICPLAFLLQIHLCFPQGTKKRRHNRKHDSSQQFVHPTVCDLLHCPLTISFPFPIYLFT